MNSNILRDDIEYIIHCDEKGNIIGPISKNHAHIPEVRKTLVHYSTWSMVYNTKLNKYGLQLKSPKKDDKNTAGKWDMGVAGHNCYELKNGAYLPNSFEDNLVKETYEEIGIKLDICDSLDDFKGRFNLSGSHGYIFESFLYKTDLDKEYVGLALICTDEKELKFNDGEVVEFRWFDEKELEEFIIKEYEKCCVVLPLVFDKTKEFMRNLF